MSESLIGKKVKLKKDKNKFLTENVLTIIFEHDVIGGDGTHSTFVGLECQGEIVGEGNNLRLFFWSDEQGYLSNDFEEVK